MSQTRRGAGGGRGWGIFPGPRRRGARLPRPQARRRRMGGLPADQVAQWRQDGFLSPFPLLDAAGLQACREGVARYERWLGAPINADAHMKWRSMPYLLMPWAAELARHPGILDKVESLIGP